MLPNPIQVELKNLGLDVCDIPRAIQTGFSGAMVYRIGEYAIKGHPLSRLSHLQRIHWAQQRWVGEILLDPCNQGDHPTWIPGLIAWPSLLGQSNATLLVDSDKCWECMDWKQGVAVGSIQQVTVSHVRSVGLALGQLHRIARRWPIESSVVESVDYRMIQRHELLKQAVDTEFRKQNLILLKWNSFSKDSSLSNTLLPLVIEALEVAIRVARPSVVAMKNLCCTASLKHWMHGDAWRGNWLFSGGDGEGLLRVSGLIDFGQAGLRWPGFDFARAIGSMGWGQSSFWQEAWESYKRILGEPGYRLEEAWLMHRVSMVLTLVAYIDRMEFGLMQDEPSMDRLREVCLQLKSL
ncbi:MAG: aminoglycoside phosphotransferase family protein [Planctomycetota bacterium]|jgi:hypothetical protein